MDEFKPEDELKPDTSDRRPTRPRKSSSAPKVAVSRQHMMMGIGILVLLLLVIGIGSALNGPSEKPQGQQAASGTAGSSGSEKSIDLSGSTSMSGQGSETQPAPSAAANAPAQSSDGQQALSGSPISPTPTQAQSVPAPENQQRVELPGDLNNALTSQQDQVNAAAQGASSTLPTAPATVTGGAQQQQPPAVKPAQQHQTAQHPASTQSHKAAPAKPAASKPAEKAGSKPAATSGHASASTPGGNYTLQLSSASRSDTLNAWAKKQNLNGYHVYKTTRNGQPWYVLVSGSYATPADAKRAVSSLPAEVRAQNPWVKPVSQVKKESVN